MRDQVSAESQISLRKLSVAGIAVAVVPYIVGLVTLRLAGVEPYYALDTWFSGMAMITIGGGSIVLLLSVIYAGFEDSFDQLLRKYRGGDGE